MMGRMKSLRAIVLCTLLGLGGVYAWMQTPSYAVYHIQQALKTRNYETFTHTVDIDSVVSYALEDLGQSVPDIPQQHDTPSDSLVGLLHKGLESLTRDVQDLAKAGVTFAIQQTFQNSDLTLPQIPTIALIGTVVGGETREDIRYFSVPLDSGEEIEIGLRYTPEGRWRVVRVTNVQALLKAVFRE